MDKRIAIWNALHDGEITAVSQTNATLTVFVSIPYLRRRLTPLGDSFVLSLKGLKSIQFRHFDGEVSDLAKAMDAGAPEILGTNSESMPVVIDTSLGTLLLDFDSIGFALDTGQSTDYETIDRVCEEYWTEWEAKAAQARGTSA